MRPGVGERKAKRWIALAGAMAMVSSSCSGADSSSGPTGGSSGADMFGNAGNTGAGAGTGGTGGLPGNAVSNPSGPSGATQGQIDPNCSAVSDTATDTITLQGADIIVAIDSSQSMTEELGFVQTYMNDFSQQIAASGIDARVILIAEASEICIAPPLGSGQCPNDTNLPGYAHIDSVVGSNDGLNVLIDSYPQWSQFLRPNTTKSFMLVTDDDATDAPNNSAASFISSLTALDPVMLADWSFSSIYCFTECPDAAAVGSVYADLVPQTGGVAGDLCLQDFQPVFDKLAMAVIATAGSQIACEWAFPDPPADRSFSAELVVVQRTSSTGDVAPLGRVGLSSECDAAGGWYFDSNASPTKVLACPETCSQIQADAGGGITITFGCETFGDACTQASSTAVNARQGADIIWAIDSSGSMSEELGFVQSYMNDFSQQIVASGIDARVVLIAEASEICIAPPLGSGQCPNDTSLPGYAHIDAVVGSNDGLNVLVDTYPQWAQFLRPNTTKSFVLVTDDDATDAPNNSAASFISNLTALDPVMLADWTFSSIYCFTDCPDAAAVGSVYADLVPQTGGVAGDLCLQDFQPVFNELAMAVVAASQIGCEWAVPPPPSGQTLDLGSVNVRYTNSAGVATAFGNVPSASDCAGHTTAWHYDDTMSMISLCPDTCAMVQGGSSASIEVLFGCETVLLPVD